MPPSNLKNKITLKEAREKGELGRFIKEHEKDACGDSDRADQALSNMVNNTKPERSLADEESEKKAKD